jgi:CBS-domain-containing membrane protein
MGRSDTQKAKDTTMTAQDIMTTSVVTVTPETLVREIASLLVERRISAVPVMDNDQLVGIVSESDLFRRYEIGTDCALSEESWWMRLFGTARLPGDYVKSHASHARDIMTRKVITVTTHMTLVEVATIFAKHGIKRVPVLQHGLLAGILSRSDLVKELAAASTRQRDKTNRVVPDERIRTLLSAELRGQQWWRPQYSNVSVQEGVVTYGGFIDFEDERTAARVAAETIPGVRSVVDNRLQYRNLISMT